ncbi:TPM domain-containing protein [Castellaniella sp. FW104-16D08]|uniref:TPM domain-containing protein n=1 Tax=unclassified Castellaniella TaxID=2617606 RepID=UPI003314D5AF
MKIPRIVRHLLTTDWYVRRCFPRSALAAIERIINDSETEHDGEIRIAIEGSLEFRTLLHAQSARERAIELFSQLRVWDTQHNNGLLIYLLLADHAVEIVADRGIHEKVSQGEWNAVCRQMESAFKRSDFESGVVDGIRMVTQHLVTHFPASSRQGANELPDEPAVL